MTRVDDGRMRELEIDWERAIDLALLPGGPLRLAFQPIVDLRRGVVAGYEVLARFDLDDHPRAPLPWLAAATQQGRLGELERSIAALALASRRLLPANTFMSLNLSAGVLVEAETSRLFTAAGDLRGLVVELTEHDRVLDYDALHVALAPTLAAGAMLAVDDAGAGYASLGHVLALRPSFVKLDRSLVTDLDREPSRHAAVAAIGALAGELDGWLVAEGIERQGELDALVDLGVPLGQGWHLGRPELDMRPTPRDVAVALQARTDEGASYRPVGPLVQEVVVRPLSASQQHELARRAAVGPAGVPEPAILVDELGVPVALEVGGRLAPGTKPMRVMPEDSLPDVALRAAGRPTPERLLPLICCDELGRPLGLLSVDRIAQALGRADDPPAV